MKQLGQNTKQGRKGYSQSVKKRQVSIFIMAHGATAIGYRVSGMAQRVSSIGYRVSGIGYAQRVSGMRNGYRVCATGIGCRDGRDGRKQIMKVSLLRM
jgi:hypothetical protein